jgi:LPXTG-motif cell wall-anchored protein
MTKAKRAAALIGLTVAFAFPAGVAAADVCVYPAVCEPTGNISGGTEPSTPAPAAAATAATTASKPATLPVTGGDVAGLTLLGGVALAGGALLMRRSRKA